MFYLFLFLFGLVWGSFLGMFCWRWPRGLSFSGRSFCDLCKSTLLWRQNIPLFSFLFFRGRCLQCGRKFGGSRYFLIEATTGALFVLTGYLWDIQSGVPLQTFREFWGIASLVLMLGLVVCWFGLFLVDLEKKLLPDGLSFFAGGLTFLLVFTLPSPLFFHHLASGLSSFLLFLLIYLLTFGRGMGFGDVKLSFFMGLLLGFPLFLVWLIVSFVLGAVVGIFLIFSKRATLRHEVPFGPFLLVSAYVVLFFGKDILNWYIRLL